ncbi:UNVERIFIED_CONTAM: Ras GTPase-activating protein 1 [Gekko kuhli]
MKALQTFCNLRKTSPGTSNKRLRQVSSLILHVEEAHTLPAKHFTNPYCNIYLNSVQVAKTHVREGQNPVWSEEFVFDDLSSDINRFEICLSNKTKKSKDPDISQKVKEGTQKDIMKVVAVLLMDIPLDMIVDE